MQGLKFFRKSRKNKKSGTGDSPSQSEGASSTPPAESTTPSSPSSAPRNTPARLESSISTQSTPAPSTRPFSEDFSPSPPSTPTPQTRPVSEAILTSTASALSALRSGAGLPETLLKPDVPPLDRTSTAPASSTRAITPPLAPISPSPAITPSPAPISPSTPSTPTPAPKSGEKSSPGTAQPDLEHQPSSTRPVIDQSSTPTVINQPPSSDLDQQTAPISTISTPSPSIPTQLDKHSRNYTAPSRTVTPTSRMAPRLSSPLNGLGGSNGVFSPPHSPRDVFRSKGRLSSFGSSHAGSGTVSRMHGYSKKTSGGGGGHKIGLVQESAAALRKRSIAELGAGVYRGISNESYVGFLEWIRSERLTTLPHKGSRWDKVLIRAVYFAEQLHKFDVAIQGFALDSSAAAGIGYGHAQLLLEIGHDNSEALDKVFSVFYKFALSFSSVLHRSELLAATPEIREQLCLLYTDLLSLVVDVAVRFYKTVNGMTSGSVSLDIFEVFGETIESFRSRQDTVVELIWGYQIEKEELNEREAIDAKVLSRWLAPQDRVLATLTRDHSTFVDSQVEFTCLWFQKHLSRFMQSEKPLMLVTGQPGGGKTTLAGSIVERLQRPINRKQYDTIFCSLSPDIPTTATSLAIVKSLLFQLLNLRVGNIGMYYSLIRAYHECRTAANLQAYEEHLWEALANTLKQPLDVGNDLVIVVDGLDEIANSQSASIQAAAGNFSPPALLEKLTNITKQGRGVRLITLSSSVKMTPNANGYYHQITRDDVRDDLHAVALRALRNNQRFHGKPGNEQEALLDRVIQLANGSFLWTILASEVLNFQKTPEAITKTLENMESTKPSAHDLILKLFTSLEVTNNAKAVLSWILAAERPLTIDEIHTLFTIDVQRDTLADNGTNIGETLNTLAPLLTVYERVVRFRHPIIHSALHNFALQNKIPIPIKDSETDLLLRVLTYAKFTLRDKGEPLIDNSDQTTADRLFHRHHFLEYTVRYWILHLQQSPLAPTPSGDFKRTAELKKAMPDTTILPILEQLCWDSQLPIPQALDMHKLAGTVRREVFTENHPSVLQTYLAVASCFLLINDLEHAQKYFNWCVKISRTILSDVHPLTLECANHFLKLTDSMSFTTRTDIVNYREEVLMILIKAYERQYGKTSEQVIQIRTLLAQLYESIKEEERAIEIYRLIQQSTVEHYGRDSHQAQEALGHLNVIIGKRPKDPNREEGPGISIFEEEQEEKDEVFNIDSIIALLEKAELYISEKKFILAEKTYVELWMEVSSRCRTILSVEWHEKNIEIATAYSQFLISQKRKSESSAVLTCIWQQYEHHQLAFSQSIVERLTVVAKEMKSIGTYTQALSIFKFASSFYQSLHQEESSISQEINEQVSQTSTEIVKLTFDSSESSSETTTTTTASESIFQQVFFQIITSIKTLDSSTIKMAKKLTAEYIEQRNWSAAIHVIQATLERTWSSFLSTSINSVTMTSTFTQESVELVEQLATCYTELKQLDKVEDTYKRFFQAVLITENVDKAIFKKAKSLLITFYDKRGYADNAISVFQELLVVYRTRLGPTHELTIKTLYILAHRCQNHPRNHPYWIEYYIQIITSLNKDSDVCHKDALEAMVIVTSTYWEDRRYAEAVTVYRVLWNTFVRKTTEHKIFKEEKFVQQLYERYYQCLEETKFSYEHLYQVTKEFHDKAIATFGAESSIAIEASLSLAQVSERSEEHASQAISLYEKLTQSSTTSTTKTKDIKRQLSLLYVKQMQSSKSSSFKKETIQRAITMTEEQFTESVSKYGYSHESSLVHLKELAVLYQREQKTDVVVKKLTTAVSEIIKKQETSSETLITSAASIASSFYACQETQAAYSLLQELHRQIIAKDAHNASKWSFDLTKSSRIALAFLASLQYNLRKDPSITFSEILADLTMEYIYFEQFRQTLAKGESLTNIMLAAAPLRFFLRRNDHKDIIILVEDKVIELFTRIDAKGLNLLSKDSPRIFIIGILDNLGNGKNKNFIRSVILASNESVLNLTQSKKFAEAYDIANIGFIYASKHDGYNSPKAISLGFKLASLLVGRDGEKCPDAGLRKKMLDLSNSIVKKILDICKNLKINFAHVQLYELSHLSSLLGEQQDYATLEWLLTTLWNTRDAQRSWPSHVLLNLGRRLICARYLAGQHVKAIRLCEDIAYNMRRAHGPRSPATIETYELLAQLYTSTGQTYQAKAASEKTAPSLAQEYFKKALAVHEDILRLLTHEEGSGDDSDDELDATAALLKREGVSVQGSTTGRDTDSVDEEEIDAPAVALRHLQLLKLAYQRLGNWPKAYDEYQRLNAQVFAVFGTEESWKNVQGVEKWSAKEFGSGRAESRDGEFGGLEDWGFGSDEVLLGEGSK